MTDLERIEAGSEDPPESATPVFSGLLGGRSGDPQGRRRIFSTGIPIFAGAGSNGRVLTA